jgi:hypothetical protein
MIPSARASEKGAVQILRLRFGWGFVMILLALWQGLFCGFMGKGFHFL